MKKLYLSGNYEVLLDDEDYEIISKMSGWYIRKEKNHNAKTNYVTHDKFGRLHRYLLGITDRTILVDHLDRNGLNNQKKNLRVTTCSKNKRNSDTICKNRFNFNGITFEKAHGNRKWRIRVKYSSNEYDAENKRYKQCTKSFGPSHGDSFNEALRKAVLFRIKKMREYDYIIDERSETIEKQCQNPEANMEIILNISFSDFDI